MIRIAELEKDDEIKYWTYITTPKAPCPIRAGSWYRMGNVNWCPLQSKVYHSSWFVLLSVIVVFRLLKEKEMCVLFDSVESVWKITFFFSRREQTEKRGW
jgi:hypothetical protein